MASPYGQPLTVRFLVLKNSQTPRHPQYIALWWSRAHLSPLWAGSLRTLWWIAAPPQPKGAQDLFLE